MITNDNYKQIHAWAKILGKIVENITPETAKECAGFCYIVISFNISRIQSDREKTLVPEYANILEDIKPVMYGDIRNIKTPLKDNYEQLSAWAEILDGISENLDLEIKDICKKFCTSIIKNECTAKIKDNRERSFASKFEHIVKKLESYNPYVIYSDTDNHVPDNIEKAQPPIPKIIHYCWLSNDPIPEKMQQCMMTWREKLPDYEFMLWNFDRFDINTSLWVKKAFDNKKYAFAADYIRLYAVYTYGGIYLDMDVEVVKSFDDLLFTDCMIARESSSTQMHIEGGCFSAVKGHPFIKQCLAFYRNRNFNPEKTDMYTIPVIMGAVLTACFKDTVNVLAQDFFTAQTCLPGIIETTKNTHAIHHFEGSWTPPEFQLKVRQAREHFSQMFQNDIDGVISLLRSRKVNKPWNDQEASTSLRLHSVKR